MKDRAYAKINLALDVFNIREDGYHDLKSIMIPINFYDELEINLADKDSYYCNKQRLIYDEKNSIYKMIEAVKQRFNLDTYYDIKLNKYVPSKAGLGGGTADGASALRILKKLHHLDLSKEDERQLCLSVGADVLFNYVNKPAVVSGIGDYVEPFVVKDEYYVLLVKPKTGVSTKEAYDTLNMDICDHPNIDILKTALINGDSIEGLLGNSLEQPALILNKDISVIKDKLIDLGAKNVLMSGSGSTVFSICKDEEQIMDLYKKLKNCDYFVRFTKILQK